MNGTGAGRLGLVLAGCGPYTIAGRNGWLFPVGRAGLIPGNGRGFYHDQTIYMPALRSICRIANACKTEYQKCSAKDRLVHDRMAGSGLTGLQATDGFQSINSSILDHDGPDRQSGLSNRSSANRHMARLKSLEWLGNKLY